MRSVRRIAMAAAIVVGALHPAVAEVPSPFNWTGYYAGGSLGYGWQSETAGITGNTLILAGLINIGSVPRSLPVDPKGWLAGAQAGYNFQFNKIVLGGEADLSLADISGRSSVSLPGVLPIATYTTTVQQRMQWFGTVRARAGYTPIDRLLVYATGGLAVGRIDYGGNIHRAAIVLNFDIPASTTVTKAGWTIGAGAEYAWTKRFSVKGEYLYYDLGSESISGIQTPSIILAQRATYSFTTRGSIVRLGLNYKFN
jgi:outer membrane immunogenic protein